MRVVDIQSKQTRGFLPEKMNIWLAVVRYSIYKLYESLNKGSKLGLISQRKLILMFQEAIEENFSAHCGVLTLCLAATVF